MSETIEGNGLKSERLTCTCGHGLFIITPSGNDTFRCNCFLCGEIKGEVVPLLEKRNTESSDCDDSSISAYLNGKEFKWLRPFGLDLYCELMVDAYADNGQELTPKD